jgi:hypothetical protein
MVKIKSGEIWSNARMEVLLSIARSGQRTLCLPHKIAIGVWCLMWHHRFKRILNSFTLMTNWGVVKATFLPRPNLFNPRVRKWKPKEQQIANWHLIPAWWQWKHPKLGGVSFLSLYFIYFISLLFSSSFCSGLHFSLVP